MTEMRIIIATGGTGGHIFPAEALYAVIREKMPNASVVFAGKNLSKNAFFSAKKYPYIDVESGPITLKKPWRSLLSLFAIIKGCYTSWRYCKRFQPDLIIAFGSFYVLPLLIVARACKISYVLHEQNALPGRVNRIFAKKAVLTAIAFPLAKQYLKGATLPVAMPLRAAAAGAKSNLEAFFENKESTLLVFGGSQGALAINRCILEALPLVKDQSIVFKVVHLCGALADRLSIEQHYKKLGIKAYVSPFEQEMSYIWQHTDVVIARAGAMTIWEMIEFGVSGILIPYPFAKDNHQNANADFMQHTVKGAIKIVESQLTKEILANAISSFFTDSQSQLRALRANISAFKETQRNPEFFQVICQTLAKG